MGTEERDEVEYDVFSRYCPSRSTLEHVTGRWGTLTLGALETGPLRFNALLRRVDGVSQKMLAQTLLALERDGFVDRENLSTAGLHVEYRLTRLGRDTAAQLLLLTGLLESRMPEVLAAQLRYDEARTGP